MATTTHISLHLITEVQAVDHNAFGKPLLLKFKSSYGDTDLTLFFTDEELSKKLAEVINDVVASRQQVPPCPHETAAYAAASYAYNGEPR